MLAAAAAWGMWLGPLAQQLPADYSAQLFYDASGRSRETATAPWTAFKLTGRRVDHTLISTASHNIIQSDLYWALPDGTLQFENAGIYGVDRRSRKNLPGLGNISRTGQFLVAPRVAQGRYDLWDSMFVGPRAARFEGVTRIEGLPVYVFHFSVRGLDETAGYGHLADVPERYRALTDGEGTFWIETETGRLVDYQERGHSYFVTPDGVRAADFYVWADRLTAESRHAQLREARNARRIALALRRGVPAGLAGLGLLLLALAARRPRHRGER